MFYLGCRYVVCPQSAARRDGAIPVIALESAEMLEPHPNNGWASCPPGGDLVKGQSAAGLLVYDDNESLSAAPLHAG